MKLENVEVLETNIRRIFPDNEAEITQAQVDISFSFDAAAQDTQQQAFPFVASVDVSCPFAEMSLRFGLTYNGFSKTWDVLESAEREKIILDYLVPDVFPYVRSLVQVFAGVLGIPPLSLTIFDPKEMKRRYVED